MPLLKNNIQKQLEAKEKYEAEQREERTKTKIKPYKDPKLNNKQRVETLLSSRSPGYVAGNILRNASKLEAELSDEDVLPESSAEPAQEVFVKGVKGNKMCSKCNEVKDKLADFHKGTNICKACKKEYNDNRKHSNTQLREELDHCYEVMGVFEEYIVNLLERMEIAEKTIEELKRPKSLKLTSLKSL